MDRIRKLATPFTPPPNPVGKKLADVTPQGTLLRHLEFVEKPGSLAAGRSTLDFFDSNFDGKADFSVSRSFDPADAQRLISQELMINAPGRPHGVAGGQTFTDRNADGFVDGFTSRTPGAGDLAVGETGLWDSDFDGRVDAVVTWGADLDPAVEDDFPGTKASDVLFRAQRDTDGDGQLDVDELHNPFIKPR